MKNYNQVYVKNSFEAAQFYCEATCCFPWDRVHRCGASEHFWGGLPFP